LTVLLVSGISTQGAGPLPEFTFKGVALHPKNLSWAPTGELEHPTVIETEGRVKNPLGRYYLYYAPHKHVGIGMAYSDSMEGPWTEYKGNPVLEGPAAPDIRWIEEKGKFYMWGHRANKRTELWTSDDGLSFEYKSVSVDGKNIGTKNASYTRFYEYPLKEYGSKYIMLYSGYAQEEGIRSVWLAHSRDAENWTQLKTPLVGPVPGEDDTIYCASLLQWDGRNFIVYQDNTGWRGGNVKYVEVDGELHPVGNKGERFILMDPPPTLNERYRSAEFYLEDDTFYMYSGAGSKPRIYVYATAEARDPLPKTDKGRTKKSNPLSTDRKQVVNGEPGSLDDILKGVELETVYETTFEESLRIIHESELIEDKKIVREPPKDIDWVLEGPGEVLVKSGRMHIKNSPDGNCVLWNTREFPESFVAEWDFKHHYPQGLAILFFAAQGVEGGSIFMPGLPRRGGNFGKCTRGKILCYHTSYTAISEDGVPRGETHLKKNDGDANQETGNKVAQGPSTIDGKAGRPHRIRVAKLGARVILEVDGEISFDWTDLGEKGGAPYGSGQIGFRQMRHTIEASYGGFKVQRVKLRAD